MLKTFGAFSFTLFTGFFFNGGPTEKWRVLTLAMIQAQ